MFHFKAGACVELSNSFKTASRINAAHEFNRGLVFSFEPLKDNELFEVRIDKKLHTWSGSVEVGVTVCNPDVIDIPITATDLRGGTWIMLGQGVLRDGRSLQEAYGSDLDKLVEGDCVGVMRTSQGELKFFVNGIAQGIAAQNIPPIVYAVIDMYGKCAQITLTHPSSPDSNPMDEDSDSDISMGTLNALANTVQQVRNRHLGTNHIPSYLRAGLARGSYSRQCQSNLIDEAGGPSPLELGLEDETNQSVDNNMEEQSVVARPPLAPTASEETSITEPSGSALTNHVANISIANSVLSGNDSNVLDEEGHCASLSLELIELAVTAHEDIPTSPTNDTIVEQEIPSTSTGSVTQPMTRGRRFEPPGHRHHRDQNNKNHIDNMATYANMADVLRFHSKCGTLVNLTNTGRTAERKRPMDEFNNGVVMTNRALLENELFEIRIDKLVSKWSGSIEVGISTHNPDLLEFPATMTNMRSGTVMMSGTGILTNGKGTLREYGQFNLDELKEGDHIGMIIKPGRNLHYLINGLEQGIAASGVSAPVWAVVDLYGMTVKVTIVDREEHNISGRVLIANQDSLNIAEGARKEDRLVFHKTCGNYAEVINEGRTAHRPNAGDDFNNGVVLTKRTLKPNERFEVQLDQLVDKWAGSLEIGVTTHPPTDLDYPTTMTNIRSGTWLMTSSGVTHNGTTTIEGYGRNLDRLKVGECVGVVRKTNGSLHFYVNNQDQGVAATNVPEKIYGVIDLYGQAAQASIVDCSSSLDVSAITLHPENISHNYSDLRFHQLHGRNAHIVRNGLMAQRPNSNGEFNDAIVMSNRQLSHGEMFEVRIDQMVERWSGSLEAGVTAIAPEQINFPSTMTDIDYETWMLSGSSVMRNGVTVMNNYACDLDALDVGTRIGMMRHSDGALHFYVNGQDQGAACENLPLGLWAVIDLYGQCAQVSVVQTMGGANSIPTPLFIDDPVFGTQTPLAAAPIQVLPHKWSKCFGANIVINSTETQAERIRLFNHSLAFSSSPLEPDEMFEIRIKKLSLAYGGSVRVGLTTLPVSDALLPSSLPSSLNSLFADDVWWVEGSTVRRNHTTILKLNYCPHLGRLRPGDHVGVKKTIDGTMKIYVNGDDCGNAASNISKDPVFAVVELAGNAECVEIISCSRQILTPSAEGAVGQVAVSQDSLELGYSACPTSPPLPGLPVARAEQEVRPSGVEENAEPNNGCFQFHENRGKNIELSPDRTSAVRVESYDQGIVFSSRPLPINTLFQVKIGALNARWSNSVMVGITGKNPDRIHLPNSAFDLKKNSWVICGDSVFFNGVKIKGRYGPDLDSLSEGFGSHVVGVLVDEEHRLHLYVNGLDQGVAAKEIPPKVFAIFDLYGQCQELTVKNPRGDSNVLSVCDADQKRIEKNNQNVQRHSTMHAAASPPLVNHNEVNSIRREAANHITEQSTKPNNKVEIKNCEYQNLCSRFIASLVVPESYFCADGKLCFCATCHKIRGEEMFHTKGNPPKQYAQPVGWCRYALVTAVGANNESWHMAYHGTHSGVLRRTLDRKELLFANELDLGASLTHRRRKHDNCDGSQLSFSPSIAYASVDVRQTVPFVDPLTGKKSLVRTVLQVAVQPGAYKVGPPSVPFQPRPCDLFEGQSWLLDSIEWVTKERGATQLLALLVSIQLPEDTT